MAFSVFIIQLAVVVAGDDGTVPKDKIHPTRHSTGTFYRARQRKPHLAVA